MPTRITSRDDIVPGEFYEDPFYHPCLCTAVEDDFLEGISLVDGSAPRMADLYASGTVKLTLDEALLWKRLGPQKVAELAESAELSPPDQEVGL